MARSTSDAIDTVISLSAVLVFGYVLVKAAPMLAQTLRGVTGSGRSNVSDLSAALAAVAGADTISNIVTITGPGGTPITNIAGATYTVAPDEQTVTSNTVNVRGADGSLIPLVASATYTG